MAFTACVAVTLCMARGPLFQRAIAIDTRPREIRGNLTLNVAQELTNNLASTSEIHWFGTHGLSADLHPVLRNASAQIPIKMNNTGCDRECEARVNVRCARAIVKFAYAVIFMDPLSRSVFNRLNGNGQSSLHCSFHVLGFHLFFSASTVSCSY
jgi:hypothetical protein